MYSAPFPNSVDYLRHPLQTFSTVERTGGSFTMLRTSLGYVIRISVESKGCQRKEDESHRSGQHGAEFVHDFPLKSRWEKAGARSLGRAVPQGTAHSERRSVLFFSLTSREPEGKAEALHRAMLALIDTGSTRDAHPATWAPFVVGGEGSAR
jgi:hypothetical protein